MNQPAVHSAATKRPRYPELVSWCAVVASAAAVLFGNLRFGNNVLALGFTDDFFYYAQVARNLAMHGRSTFDGIHPTNGYHPLWLLMLTLITTLFGAGGWFHAATVIPFAIALETVQFCLVLAIAFFALRILRLTCGVVASCCLQMLLTVFSLILVRTGMEVGLTLAIIFAMLWFRLRPTFRWSGSTSLAYGFIASAIVLSRLDSILLIALLFVFDVIPSAQDAIGRLRLGTWFCIGMSPVPAYLLLNEWLFRTLLPISGTAKQLRLHHVPSLSALHSFFAFCNGQTFFLLGPCVLLAGVALFFLATRKFNALTGRRGVVCAVLLFPPLHLLTVVTLSDWILWPWYLYAWPVAAAIAAVTLASDRAIVAEKQAPSPNGLMALAASTIYLLLYATAIVAYSNPAHSNDMYLTGLDVMQFAADHPGIYAMGDRAGAVGYLANVPVIQLEGLMMDKPYLENIRARGDLLTVLKRYGVRYYIWSARGAAPGADGCYAVKEPAQAGPDSPAMTMRLCKTPVAAIHHGDYVNVLFDMQ